MARVGRPKHTTDAERGLAGTVVGRSVSPLSVIKHRSWYADRLASRKIKDRHRVILRQVLLGDSDKHIAEMLGITRETVGIVRRSAAGRAELDRMHQEADKGTIDINQRIKEAAPAAFEVLQSAITGAAMNDGTEITLNSKDRVAACFRMLELCGHSPVRKVEGKHLHGVVTGDILDMVNARAEECSELLYEDSEAS